MFRPIVHVSIDLFSFKEDEQVNNVFIDLSQTPKEDNVVEGSKDVPNIGDIWV